MGEGWGQIPSDIKAEGKRDPGQPASPLTCLLTNTPQRRALERLRRATGGEVGTGPKSIPARGNYRTRATAPAGPIGLAPLPGQLKRLVSNKSLVTHWGGRGSAFANFCFLLSSKFGRGHLLQQPYQRPWLPSRMFWEGNFSRVLTNPAPTF